MVVGGEYIHREEESNTQPIHQYGINPIHFMAFQFLVVQTLPHIKEYNFLSIPKNNSQKMTQKLHPSYLSLE